MTKRVLCVDDNEDTCLMLSLLLKLAGYEVATAGTVADGLNLAKNQDFDLYLLDSRLADGSSLQFCQEIRSSDRHTPIIFCSGSAGLEDQQEAIGAGANAYLTKPVEPDVLKETMHSLLYKASHAGRSA
jgi:DNA-binding response OmpR family regulator